MSYDINATTRTALGRQSKQTLEEGLIPCVIYGHGIEPRSIQVVRGEFRKVYRQAGTSSLVDVIIDNSAPVKALIQEVQVDIVMMEPVHIDFRQIRMDEKVTVEVPLHVIGESKAVKELAGTLMVSMNEVTVECLPGDLPHEIIVDISKLATFEDSITIGSLDLGKGVESTQDATLVVAAVIRPLTEDELKKMEETTKGDVSGIKTEAEEKKATEAAKKAADEAANGKK